MSCVCINFQHAHKPSFPLVHLASSNGQRNQTKPKLNRLFKTKTKPVGQVETKPNHLIKNLNLTNKVKLIKYLKKKKY